MTEKIKEEWTELVEESKMYAASIENFFKEKAPKERPEEPEITDTEIEAIGEIDGVRERTDEEILGYPNVVGIATGYLLKAGKVTQELGMQILVEKKIAEAQLASKEKLPKEMEGIKTDVIATGRIEALGITGTYRPTFPGASIGHPAITAGTFGCLVQDKEDHEFLILSNNHVLANSNSAAIGDPILQPGRYDGGTYPAHVIAKLKKFIPLLPGYNLVDAAVAKPLDQRLVIASIPWIGIPRGTAQARLGWKVQKTGRTTQYTTGKVTSTNATVLVNYGSSGTFKFKNQIMTTDMSAGGDSGSLVVDPYAMAVGLLFAGSSTVSIHNHISNVLMALGIEMVEAL